MEDSRPSVPLGTPRQWTEREKRLMQKALDQGRKALQEGEVPVGCVIVRRPAGKEGAPGEAEEEAIDAGIIATGSNKTNEQRDATLHAEVVAINKAMEQLRQTRVQDPRPLRVRWAELFADCELYVTCEPCIMCAGALRCVGISKVYFGCSNERFGGCGSVLRLHDQELPGLASYKCETGLFAEEAVVLLKQFYLDGNPHAPNPKRPVVMQAETTSRS